MTVDLPLAARWTEFLRRLPESGMGYQRVRVGLKSGATVPEAIVLNGHILRLPATAPAATPDDITDIQLLAPTGR